MFAPLAWPVPVAIAGLAVTPPMPWLVGLVSKALVGAQLSFGAETSRIAK